MSEQTNETIKTKEKKKNNKLMIVIVFTFVIICALFSFISYKSQNLEIFEIGEKYLQVFSTNMRYKAYIMLANFVIIFLVLYITNKIIRKGLKQFFEQEKKTFPKIPNKSISLIIALVVSMFISNIFLEKTILFLNSTEFGITDPAFNLDVGFYMFQKPFYEMLILYFIMLFIGLSIYIAIYYIIAFNVFFDGVDGQTLRKSVFIKQLLTNAIFIIIGIAAFIIMRTQGVVIDKFLNINDELETAINGAGTTEIYIEVWGYRILTIIMVIAVIIAIRAFNQKNTKKTVISLLSVPTYLVLLFFVMVIFKATYVNKNQLDKESEYISTNIKFTKTAYNVKIEEVSLENASTITLEEANKNQNVLKNIPVVTSDIVLTTLNQSMTNTGYYKYDYVKTNLLKNRLAYISSREISSESRTYNNKTYQYTHGYGIVSTYASETDENGNIVYINKEFKNNSNDNIQVRQPRIYYGMETNDNIIVNIENNEFDYPISSTEFEKNSYEGKGGIKAKFVDKLLLAIGEKDIKLAFIDNNSKILVNRNIRERAKKVIPYLLYDEEPYLVIDDSGNLVWVLDAYTTSSQYPYSQATTIIYENSKQEINYIRNSIKILVNAYDGTMDFYITDKTDPIAMAYYNMYDGVFKDSSEIPEDISKYFVYSEYLYKIQSKILNLYHNVTADVLYRGDDVWEPASYSTSATTSVKTEMEPYYTILKTTNSDDSELGLVLPYTISDKQSLTSYLVGTVKENQNKLTLYKYGAENNIMGPMQFNNLIEQDENIASEISSLNVTGTRIIKKMVIVPINNTLLYVETIFQLSLNETQSVPILKKVVVASGNKLAIGNNLEEAIKNLLSNEYFVNIEVESTDTIDNLMYSIIKANKNLTDSNNANNWEQIGKDIEKLQSLIKQLENLVEKDAKTSQEQITEETSR